MAKVQEVLKQREEGAPSSLLQARKAVEAGAVELFTTSRPGVTESQTITSLYNGIRLLLEAEEAALSGAGASPDGE